MDFRKYACLFEANDFWTAFRNILRPTHMKRLIEKVNCEYKK